MFFQFSFKQTLSNSLSFSHTHTHTYVQVDISGQIKSSLIAELSDKNWKVRGEGLTKVQEILAQAKFIQPSLGELPGALKARLGDTNKNHVRFDTCHVIIGGGHVTYFL